MDWNSEHLKKIMWLQGELNVIPYKKDGAPEAFESIMDSGMIKDEYVSEWRALQKEAKDTKESMDNKAK